MRLQYTKIKLDMTLPKPNMRVVLRKGNQDVTASCTGCPSVTRLSSPLKKSSFGTCMVVILVGCLSSAKATWVKKADPWSPVHGFRVAFRTQAVYILDIKWTLRFHPVPRNPVTAPVR